MNAAMVPGMAMMMPAIGAVMYDRSKNQTCDYCSRYPIAVGIGFICASSGKCHRQRQSKQPISEYAKDGWFGIGHSILHLLVEFPQMGHFSTEG
jgi:hypothetical protein